jgi:5-methylcytosine-specific restriction endonuclease McrA
MCRPCRAAYHHEHYSANKIRYIAQAAASKQRLRLQRTAWLLDYFAAHPCCDCGETDPIVLEFDHLRDKVFDVAQALPYRNWASILAEIEKCEVVCANCHRRRTARRHGTVRATMTAMNLAGD